MKVLALDCFGTVFDSSNVPKEDVRSYIAQVQRPEWAPLELPISFCGMQPHPDAAEGINRLRAKFRVVTCSNLPVLLLHDLSQLGGVEWDAIVPLEARRCYKPDHNAYWAVSDLMGVPPSQVTVVTAHANGPDIEGAPRAGMQVQLIRNPGCPADINALADELGC